MSKTTNSNYTIVIGLEVHVQLLTKTKLFCGCTTEFGLPPNSATCPICIGMPGVLPVMNREAFELSLKAALALNCQIAGFTKWDRKNYYYPDLPKNYQISQYDLPFSKDGWLEIETGGETKRIGLIRVHLEEDAGKMMHDESGRGQDSLVDLNRTGTPLLEIVSQPEIRSPEEAKDYLEELRLLLRELKVSDCEMQEGSLRVDANVNIHTQKNGKLAATPIVEVKNLNSFRAVERAMAYEAGRQYEEFQETGKKLGEVPKATAGWDEARGVTNILRRKEEASDYRYFPEPDLVPIEVDDTWLARIRSSMGELPAARRREFMERGLSAYDAGVIVAASAALIGKAEMRASGTVLSFADYVKRVAELTGDLKAAANWCNNDVLRTINDGRQAPPAEAVADLELRRKKHNINMQRAREVYGQMVETGKPAEAIIKELGLDAAFDAVQLRELVKKSIAANPKAVADVKAGKGKAIDALVGPVMRETKGKAPTDEIRRLLTEELAKV